MDLILWRHAEAHEAAPGEDDMSRCLTPRGERQAIRMAQWLERQLPEGTRILCSPAKRTEQTAMALGRKYKLSSAITPQSTADMLLAAVQLVVSSIWPPGSRWNLPGRSSDPQRRIFVKKGSPVARLRALLERAKELVQAGLGRLRLRKAP